MAWFYDVEIYHSGCLGYGRALRPEEWYTAHNQVRVEAIMWVDEIGSVSLKGRDHANIQSVQNQGSTSIRKQRLEVFYSGAMGPEGSGLALRQSVDELWRPEKLDVKFTREEEERRERQSPQPGNDPANFHFSYLYADDKPFPAKSTFDRVLGRSEADLENLPIRRKFLDARWMRQINPLLDTFMPPPIGVSMGIPKNNVVALANGDASALAQPARGSQVEGALTRRGAATAMQFWGEIGNLTRAFREGRLDVPPVLADGDKNPLAQFLAAGDHRHCRPLRAVRKEI